MGKYRRVTEDDYKLVREVCESTLSRAVARDNKEWISLVDIEAVMIHIFDYDTNAYIVEDSYLVVFDVGAAWFSSEHTLMEQLVLSLRQGKPFSVVTDFLEEQAMRHGVKLISVGTSLAPSDAALARLYSRQGFTQEAIALIKRVCRNVQLTSGKVQSP